MTEEDYDIDVAKEYTTLQERIATLEKENAELREYNKYLKRKRQGGIQKQYNKVAIIKQQDDQLTNAKEIISEYINILKGDTKNWKKTQEKAEQFLKSSEVER